VIDQIFAGEFQLFVIVLFVETHAPFRQRHTEMIRFRILEFAHDRDFRFHFRADVLVVADIFHSITAPLVPIDLQSVVNVNAL